MLVPPPLDLCTFFGPGNDTVPASKPRPDVTGSSDTRSPGSTHLWRAQLKCSKPNHPAGGSFQRGRGPPLRQGARRVSEAGWDPPARLATN